MLRRELANRAATDKSEQLKKFCSLTPGILKKQSSLKVVVDRLKTEDVLSTLDSSSVLFALLSLQFGTLKSEYYDTKTQNDIFFVEESGKMECFRFVVAFEVDGITKVLAEQPIFPTEQTFSSLRSGVEELSNTELHYGLEILKMMDSYEGITCGKLTGRRTIIDASSICSLGCYTYCSDSIVALAINGIPIHN